MTLSVSHNHQFQEIKAWNISLCVMILNLYNIWVSLSERSDKILTLIFYFFFFWCTCTSVFTLMLNTVRAFSATASSFWVTAVSLVMWCNAQILFMFSLCKIQKIRQTGRKKNIRIFGVRMFTVYVKASIGSYCFIPACHVRNSFSFFMLSVEMPLIVAAMVLWVVFYWSK